MLKNLALVTSLLVASTTVASAGTTADTARDPGTATTLAITGSAISVGLVGLGLATGTGETLLLGAGTGLLLPSMGAWYSHKFLTPGMGIRLGALALGTAGVITVAGESLDGEETGKADHTASTVMLTGAAVTFVAGCIYDIATADNYARRYNNNRGLTITPTAVSTGQGTTMGIGFAGRF